jgi:Na+-driven multidrug efflux pump
VHVRDAGCGDNPEVAAKKVGKHGPECEMLVCFRGLAFHITAMAFMLPMGVGTACATLIANELG